MGDLNKEEKIRREKLAQLGLKVCSKCKRELPFDCFTKNKNNKDGYNTQCKECYAEWHRGYYNKNQKAIKDKSRQWRQDNFDRAHEYEKKYREEHPDKMKQYYLDNIEYFRQWRQDYQHEYYEQNKDRIIAYQKQYRIDNEELVRIRRQKYYEENRARLLQEKKEYRDSHKEERKQWLHSEAGIASSRASRNKRRSLTGGANGAFSKEDVLELLNFFDNKCAYTGEPLDADYHLDHILALSKGGTNYIYNIVPCNKQCNWSKHTRDMEEWFREQEYFSEDRLRKIYEWMNIKQKERKGAINNEPKHMEEIA